ncbi:type IX secretion system anionic LPS delivery protein PorZ [Prevotella sp.]|uniref:type IX secretion system anionic LPS delivery protein PorZ n=1 Tax=Prevotella sp. TaxID=59823 RepID=UPI001CB0FE9E|nr:Por secretion system protein [Prevotella sp.]MBF1618426.1 Por secretion system protein [Prevotella sp.]
MTIKRYLLVAAFILLAYCNALAGGVGTWKNYLAYSDVQWVEEGSNKLYVLASNSLYTYNKNDQSIKTYDKVNGLSDTDIRFIAWNKTARRLVIIYSNNNIDLLDDRGNVTNVPDYYLKTTMADKTINGIDMSGVYCYLSTGFGLVKLNVAKAEISDSYNLSFPVNYSYIEGGYIYAASQSNGLYRAPLTANLLDKNNWTQVGGYVARPKTMDANLLNQAKTLNPGGPKYNGFAYIQYLNNRLYTVPGMFKSGYADSNTPGAVQILHDGEWANYQENLSLKTGYDYLDNNVLAVDPRNANHVFVGGRTGLYEFLDGQLKAYYNKDNSLLQGAMYKGRELGNNYVLINGLCFDNKGDLWILNSQASRENLLRLSADGQMTSFSKPALMKDGVGGSVLTSMVFDNRNNLWFCNDHWDYPALFCYQPTTDKLLSFTRFVNEDGSNLDLVPHSVMPLSNGDVWVTTTIGPLLLSRSAIDNPETAVFTQVKVPRNDGTNLADYLLSGIDVTCMAIDGGGRKWFGTKANGVYLISADNMTQVKHITSSNSLLLSDNILSIAINNTTGEVFFGTDKGLCSYMSDATTPSDRPSGDNTYAYPNPVRPGYTGPITIVGLSMNADVKIVTTNGVLVAAGISNGGSFIWDGKDKSGKPVASGVYMVESADEDGNNGVVCKVAIVR